MQTLQRLIGHYERGHITVTELLLALVRTITEDNAAEVVASLPLEILEQARAYVEGAPRTEEGWAGFRSFCAVSLLHDTREQIEAVRAEERRLHRRGVEVLRDIFGPLPFR